MRWYNPMSIKWRFLKELPRRHPKLFWGSMAGAGGILYLKAWIPLTGLALQCPIHAVTGLYCPGCGITRAATSLVGLDIHQAFRFNPLLFLLLPLYGAYAWAHAKGKRRWSQGIMIGMLVLTLSFGVARNLPPWSFLAPTELGG